MSRCGVGGSSARLLIHPLSENYSVFSPEVLLSHDGGSLGAPNHDLARRLLAADALVVAGQAASHCVKSSLQGLLDFILEEDPMLARKVYVLRDCMSTVAAGTAGEFVFDFTPEADAALGRFAEAGMRWWSRRRRWRPGPGSERARSPAPGAAAAASRGALPSVPRRLVRRID